MPPGMWRLAQDYYVRSEAEDPERAAEALRRLQMWIAENSGDPNAQTGRRIVARAREQLKIRRPGR